jgi:ribonuclease VapC
VNLAETATKLLERGMTAQTARAAVDATGVTVAPHTSDQAWAAAGLSFGDRACLALARERRTKAYTSDRA